MPYDPNGFNYQGESVLNLYNTSYPYSDSFVTLSNFKKNGKDLATIITPAFNNSNNTTTDGTKTYNAYQGFPGKGITFDTAFSVSAPDTRGRVKPSTYYTIYGSNKLIQLLHNNNGYIYFTHARTTG